MPIRYIFDCIDGLYFSDDAFIEQFFDRLIELRVAKDMANYNNAVTFVSFFLKLDTFLKAGGNGLLQQYVVALFECGNGVADMLGVLSGDNHYIGEARLSEQLLGGGKNVLLRHAVILTGHFALGGIGLGHCDYLHFFGMYFLKA